MSKKCFSFKHTSQPHITSYQAAEHMTKHKTNGDLYADIPQRAAVIPSGLCRAAGSQRGGRARRHLHKPEPLLGLG